MPWSLRKHISAIRSLRSGECGCTHTDTSLQQLWETTTNRFWETTMNRFIILRPLASAAVLAVAAMGVAPAFAARPQASASSLSRMSPMALSMPTVFQGTVGGGHRAHRTSASKPAAASTPTACPTSTPGRARRARRSRSGRERLRWWQRPLVQQELLTLRTPQRATLAPESSIQAHFGV
jgi:hypothetical protein